MARWRLAYCVANKTRLAAGFAEVKIPDPGSRLRRVRDDAMAKAFAQDANALSRHLILPSL